MEYANITLAREDGVGRLTLNRPGALNALDRATGEELLDALELLRDDDAVRAIVLTGAGRAFSAGGDVKEMGRSGDELSEEFFDELLATLNRSILALAEMPKPVLAAVNGIAAGLGFNLALAADVRIAARSAEFTQAFLRLGLIPDGGGTFFLPRVVGWARATELILTARTVSSEEALRLGLVTEVVDDTDFDATVEAWTRRLAEAPTAAVGRVKQLLAHSLTADLKSQLRFEREMQMASGRTADFREGLTAFFERRAPRFTGK
jgi:2-(1,2-epoxy-1,2-dihydrophenyl)acetyl-CoA isomerase